MHAGGTGNDAWYVFEPVKPRPRTAPLAIVMHGYGEFAGYDQMYEFIRHTVRKGSVVIYPRWQTDIATPCPGPVRHRAVHDVRGERHPRRPGVPAREPKRRVQPRPRRTSYFGFSFGGIITANLANRYRRCTCPSRGRSSSRTPTTAA